MEMDNPTRIGHCGKPQGQADHAVDQFRATESYFSTSDRRIMAIRMEYRLRWRLRLQSGVAQNASSTSQIRPIHARREFFCLFLDQRTGHGGKD